MLRSWKEADAPLLREAIDNSLDHLRRWMPWAIEEPKSMEETRVRLRKYAAMFEAGEEFIYGVFNRDQSEVIGGSGLHRRLNEASRRVPMKLGYRFRETLVGDRQTPDGTPRDTVVFEITHAEGVVNTLREQID